MDFYHLALIIYLAFRLCDFSKGAHFRGSMISWRVVNDTSSPLVVEIFQRHAWLYTYYNAPPCSAASIPNGVPLLGNNSYKLVCIKTCPTNLTTLGSIQVPCTGYNIDEQYAIGEGRFTVKVPKNSSFIATFSSTAWFTLVTGYNLEWSVAVQIQTFKRSDIGKYNNAPIITMLPIYRLRNKVSYSIKINVADNDFDPYICLWSQGTTQCGGLTNNVPGGIIDNYQCYLNFTPQTVGYYAVAITAEDFMILPTNVSASNYLSQVPIQFLFNVYSSSEPCVTGPVFIGDLAPDTCIYMSVGDTYTTRVRFQVQCANSTVNSTISVNPTGLLTTPIQQDPFDPTIFVFIASFTSNAQQVGQNLFCFAAVDSIGNQGDSACLRFTVASQTSSLQPLYIWNATRYPMGTVTKTTSIWTILTGSRVYIRPTTESYIRFKQVSDDVDYYVLNVVTATDNVLYYSDRIVINSVVVWTPGEYFYIYFDAGVLVEADTCTKDAMPISDPTFWPFNIPYETTTTTATSTTTTSVSSTTTPRTIPTHRTPGTSSSSTSTDSTTVTTVTTSTTSISTTTIPSTFQLSISAIVGITIGSLIIFSLITFTSISILRVVLFRFLLLRTGLRQHLLGNRSSPSFTTISDLTNCTDVPMIPQYKLAMRTSRLESVSKYMVCSSENMPRTSVADVNM